MPPPPNSHVKVLTPNVIASGGGAFERWVGHGGGALMSDISYPYKRDPQELHGKMEADLRSVQPRRGPHQNPVMPILIWDFQPLHLQQMNFCYVCYTQSMGLFKSSWNWLRWQGLFPGWEKHGFYVKATNKSTGMKAHTFELKLSQSHLPMEIQNKC